MFRILDCILKVMRSHLKFLRRGATPPDLHFVKSSWAKVKRDGFGEKTKRAVIVVQARTDEGLN